jgi:hypothetical protein
MDKFNHRMQKRNLHSDVSRKTPLLGFSTESLACFETDGFDAGIVIFCRDLQEAANQ